MSSQIYSIIPIKVFLQKGKMTVLWKKSVQKKAVPSVSIIPDSGNKNK